MKQKKHIYIIVIVYLLAQHSFAYAAIKNSPKVTRGFRFPWYNKISKKVRHGNTFYSKGNFKEALKQYEDAFLESPDSDVINFNLGTALYKNEDYKRAISHFEKSLLSEDLDILQKANYNIANAEYKHGIAQEDTDIAGAVKLLEKSLSNYEQSLSLDPEDVDVKNNYEFVKKELERLKAKLEQQQDEQQSEDQQQDQEQQQQNQQQNQEQQDQQQGEQQQEEQQQSEQQQSQREDEEEPKQTRQNEGGQARQNEGGQATNNKSATEKADKQQATDSQQMSEKEAVMLLDGYRHEEEPRALYKEKMEPQNLPSVSKDW